MCYIGFENVRNFHFVYVNEELEREGGGDVAT